MKVKREDLASSIFDTLSLYCVENELHQLIKKLTDKELKEIQDKIEEFLKANKIDVE